MDGHATVEFGACCSCEILNGSYQLEGRQLTFDLPAPTADCYRHRIREFRRRFNSIEIYAIGPCPDTFCEISLMNGDGDVVLIYQRSADI